MTTSYDSRNVLIVVQKAAKEELVCLQTGNSIFYYGDVQLFLKHKISDWAS